jgi:Flp pilus assembly protein TadD
VYFKAAGTADMIGRVRLHGASLLAALQLMVFAAPADSLARGEEAFRRGDWTGAEREFASAVREQPQSARAYKWLGMTYTAQNNFGAAEEPFRRACELDAREELACYYLGRTYYALSRFKESQVVL